MMRVRVAIGLAVIPMVLGSGAGAHSYSHADRYAGCLVGEAIPLMRRGTERERALSMASDHCIAWSEGLSAADVRAVDVSIHREIEGLEHSGL